MRHHAHYLLAGVLAVLLTPGVLYAQCAAGDVLWVSEDVDANVGLGGGAAGTCGSRTVSGAACNDSGMPFGIQAAFDCVRPGAEIRILAGNGNYGSTTNSWNNRVDATKTVFPNISGASNNIITIRGYVDTGTPCTSHQQTGCLVTLDFTGGTAIGIDPTTSLNHTGWVGLRITGAAGDCMDVNWSFQGAMYAMELDNCGGIGLDDTQNNALSFVYAHDNATQGAEMGSSNRLVFSEFHDNGGAGISPNINSSMERMLTYDNGTSGVGGGSLQRVNILYATMAANGSDGLNPGASDSAHAGGWGLIATANVDDGMENYANLGGGSTMTMFQCWFAGGNGDQSLVSPAFPPGPTFAGIRNTPDEVTVPVFASATDFTVSGINPCSFSYPGGTTILTSCAGASPSCGGVGLFIQAVR